MQVSRDFQRRKTEEGIWVLSYRKLPARLARPPFSARQEGGPQRPAMAGRWKVLKQKIFTPLNPTGNFQHILANEFGIGCTTSSYLLCHHLTGAVYPWPRPGLKARAIFPQTKSMPSWHYAHMTSRLPIPSRSRDEEGRPVNPVSLRFASSLALHSSCLSAMPAAPALWNAKAIPLG